MFNLIQPGKPSRVPYVRIGLEKQETDNLLSETAALSESQNKLKSEMDLVHLISKTNKLQ